MADAEKQRGRPRCFDKDEALDLAIGVFHENGYEGCSLDDLTGALGINRPSLYAAFGNKEDLFIAVLRKYHNKYEQNFESLVARDLPPKEMIKEWLSWFLEIYKEQKDPIGCMIVNSTMLAGESNPKISEQLKEFHDLNEKLLTDYFENETSKGRFSDDPASTAQFYNAIVQGMAVLHRSQRDYEALKNIASSAMNAWPE